MKHQIKKYWSIFWKFRMLHLMRQMEYRGDFLFWTVVATMWTIFNFFFYILIAGVNGGIAGWSIIEMYILMAVFSLLDTFTWSFFYQNMQEYTNSIFSGKMNMLLTKPIDTQFMLMTQTNSLNNIFRFFIGIGVLAWAVPQLEVSVSLFTWLLFVIMFIVALAFIYFLWFFLSTFAFWVEKLDNINNMIPAMRRVWQVPRQVYTGITSVLLTLVIPIGLVVSVPSEILVSKAAPFWLLYLTGFAVGMFFISRWFFNFSIKKYSGIGN
jgi:ABC-2 type transport system permease protein